MNKKLISIIIVVLLAAALLFGYNTYFGPNVEKGSKSITVEVVIEDQEISTTYDLKTDAELLYAFLLEREDKLGASFQASDFGTMLTGMEDYVADPSNNEYFHIYINGEGAMVGIEDIPVLDGDIYKFELKKW